MRSQLSLPLVNLPLEIAIREYLHLKSVLMLRTRIYGLSMNDCGRNSGLNFPTATDTKIAQQEHGEVRHNNSPYKVLQFRVAWRIIELET